MSRPGQDWNILRLYSRLAPVLFRATGEVPTCFCPEPSPWEAWARGYFRAPHPLARDPGSPPPLVIGFELSPGQKSSLPRWVDIRRHPIRFTGEFYGITSNLPGVLPAAERHVQPIEPPRLFGTAQENYGVLALQVHADASLLKQDGSLIGWDDVANDALAWARPLKRVLVSPHPLEPEPPWLRAILMEMPVQLWRGSTYAAMDLCGHMACVNSSAGVEAAWFDCRATFFGAPPAAAPPINVEDVGFWADALGAEPAVASV